MTCSHPIRTLNHYETVYRPGEASLIKSFFQLLGLETKTLGPESNPFIVGFQDAATMNDIDNNIAASQVLPEQWAFDQALMNALDEGPLRVAFAEFAEMRSRTPYFTTHVGMRFEGLEHWQAIVDRVKDVEKFAPELSGRVFLARVFYPGDEGSLSDITHQAFVWTDLLACGSLALGQLFELQHFDFVAYREEMVKPM
jgi:hypothetical protein